MRYRRRTSAPIILAASLLCLVLVSGHFVSGILARYTLGGSGEDSTRAAAFAVSATADEASPVSIVSDGTDENGKATYDVTVKNDGETAVRYVATVVFTGDDAQENAGKFGSANDELTFTGVLEPNAEAVETVTLDMSDYFETNNKWSTFSNDDISGVKGKAPFSVNVTFTQID